MKGANTINHREDAESIYDEMYSNEIKPCVDLILQGRNEEAYRKYKKLIASLKHIYYLKAGYEVLLLLRNGIE